MSAPPSSSLPTESLPAQAAGPGIHEDDVVAKDPKTASKRKIYGFGKKDGEDKAAGTIDPPVSFPRNPNPLPSPPNETKYAMMPHSPAQIRSPSPRLHSPASSQIFERNVQESNVPGELSPAIPSHIQTEDHIPPVLEASSLAITDDHLNPDEVEIVMHSMHQPAAAAVAGDNVSEAVTSPVHVPVPDDTASHRHMEESGSTYGSLDSNDVRRLSFISFADVVQSEHVEHSKDSLHHMALSSPSIGRSPSPMRSPTSSHGLGTSPPTSGSPSMHGVDAISSKVPKTTGSPHASGTHSPTNSGGEITIETMRQALRKTGSGDLGGARSPSQPLSAVSIEDSNMDNAPFR